MNLIIILFILVISFLLLIKNKKENLTNDTRWLEYRLGDIITGQCYRKKHERKYFNSIDKLYPGSIADEYIKNTNHLKKKRFYNYNILNNIVKERSKELKDLPKQDDVVIHLRIGDSILGYKDGKFIYNERPKRFKSKTYAIKLESMDKILDDLGDVKKIILIFGSHKNNNNKYNDLYLEEIEKLIKKRNISVEKKNSGNPDKDFLYMSNARKFIKSNGMFSLIISKIIELNNGLIIDSDEY